MKYASIRENVNFEDLYQMGYISLGRSLHFFPRAVRQYMNCKVKIYII